MSIRIEELNLLNQQINDLNNEIEAALDTQENIVKELLHEYTEIARWYVESKYNFENVYQGRKRKIIIVESENGSLYLWDPDFNVISYIDVEQRDVEREVTVKDMLESGYFKQIITNVKDLDNTLKEYHNSRMVIREKLIKEIKNF